MSLTSRPYHPGAVFQDVFGLVPGGTLAFVGTVGVGGGSGLHPHPLIVILSPEAHYPAGQ